jgi:phosphoglycolate phosphatase
MIKAVLFDLDGTIADTVESIAMASNRALEACGLEPRDIEEYNFYAGNGADTLVRRALNAAGDKEGINFDKVFKEYKGFFEKYCTYKVKAYNGMKETLDIIKKKGIRIAVVTNKPHDRAVTVVETLYGKGYFDFIIGQTSKMEKKPDPAMAIYAADFLGISKEACMYVGDTDVDMITGNAAGMYTIGVLWGFRDKEELIENHANALVFKPEALLELL